MWQDNLRKVAPYVPGEQPKVTDVIKLNTNENPYPPSPRVKEALAAMDMDRMRLYPPVDGAELTTALSEHFHRPENNFFVGVGSDDVLSVIFQTCFNSDKPLLFPKISYSFYSVWADLYGVKYSAVPLNPDFTLDPEGYKIANGGIVIANPNAPTSIAAPLSVIEEIIAANPGSVVVIDEAYVDFGAESAVSLLDKYENLLVVQTFSKSRSMAGMRIGFAIGCEKLIAAMNDVKFAINSYTMNFPALIAGEAAFRDVEYFEKCRKKIMATRENAVKKLTELGFTVLPSSANFVFAAHSSVPAEKIFNELKATNIFVRYFKKPMIDNYLRITIGTDEQMEKLYEALGDILSR